MAALPFEAAIRADERQKVVWEYARHAEPVVAAAVRADQTRRIVEWLRGDSNTTLATSQQHADAIAYKFGEPVQGPGTVQ